MWTSIVLSICLASTPANHSCVKVFQSYPVHRNSYAMMRSPDQDQAVILVHGLDLREDGTCPTVPRFKGWQGSTSCFVREMSKQADVYSLSYAQNACVEDIACETELKQAIGQVKELGYKKIALVGYSAGGLVVRHFIEDHPDAGVDTAIQVAAPNGGVKLADWGINLSLIPDKLQPFLNSLGYQHRQTILDCRKHKTIPASTNFVVVIATKTPRSNSDGRIHCASQWSRDLQLQGIPCVRIQAKHEEVMYHHRCIDTICSLLKSDHPRWGRAQVFRTRKLLGLL